MWNPPIKINDCIISLNVDKINSLLESQLRADLKRDVEL